MSYQVTVRRGPKVERFKRESLDEAIETLEHHARFVPRRGGVDFVNRRYEPERPGRGADRAQGLRRARRRRRAR